VYFWTCGSSEISCEISIVRERNPMNLSWERLGPTWKNSCIFLRRLLNSFFPNMFEMRKHSDIYRDEWNCLVSKRNMSSIFVSSDHNHLRNKASTTEDRFPCERTIHLRLNPGCTGRLEFQESFLRPLGTFPEKDRILLNHCDS